jgi:hypothetical protein
MIAVEVSIIRIDPHEACSHRACHVGGSDRNVDL